MYVLLIDSRYPNCLSTQEQLPDRKQACWWPDKAARLLCLQLSVLLEECAGAGCCACWLVCRGPELGVQRPCTASLVRSHVFSYCPSLCTYVTCLMLACTREPRHANCFRYSLELKYETDLFRASSDSCPFALPPPHPTPSALLIPYSMTSIGWGGCWVRGFVV